MAIMSGLVQWLKLSTLVLLFTGCISESQHQAYRGSTANGPHARGTVEDVEHLRSYSALHLRLLLAFARLPEHIPVENGADLYRVSYWTQHLGHPELASGLFTLPRGRAPRATVMWLNGTNPTRSEAPSMGSITGLFVSAREYRRDREACRPGRLAVTTALTARLSPRDLLRSARIRRFSHRPAALAGEE